MRPWICALVLLTLAGCEEKSDQADSVSGPSIEVHCDAATPQGSTTAKIVCPGG